MVSARKMPAALFAIHCVLIKARWLAGERADHEKLYKLLDWGELLPVLASSREEDTTEDFRQTLAGLGEDFPDCAGFLHNFDNDVAFKSRQPKS
jgi:hypothetical protein